MKDNEQASEPTQEGAHTPGITELDKERVRAWAERYAEGFKTGEWFERIRIEAGIAIGEKTTNYHRRDVVNLHSYIDNQLEMLRARNAEIDSLTQQFTDYRKQSEGEIERLKKELTLRSGVRYTLMIDEIKQSGERIERLEAALKGIVNYIQDDIVTEHERKLFNAAQSALGGTEQ